MKRKAIGNIRTGRLQAKLESKFKFRLSDADRSFLKDLSKVHLIDEDVANQYHYLSNKSDSTRRLDKLCEYGILKKEYSVIPNERRLAYYRFSSDSIARSFGGRLPSCGVNRQSYHELLVSKTYFALERPDTFLTVNDFGDSEYKLFNATVPSFNHNAKTSLHHFASESALPDAIFTDAEGDMVVVEADAGHYTTAQIRQKMNVWKGYKQVWSQPHKAAKIPSVCNANTFKF